ncbi:hypothetical protein CDAR_600341 [Caerostris darwini]|uniref:Uncharacterized protein n=1 Tax=Caerostris darwini TaxID=1538125 RepID=A0AAV4TVM1_9ARAC|nr:hypothetical protein CDAR_600341 [Caerostris darwini]
MPVNPIPTENKFKILAEVNMITDKEHLPHNPTECAKSSLPRELLAEGAFCRGNPLPIELSSEGALFRGSSLLIELSVEGALRR